MTLGPISTLFLPLALQSAPLLYEDLASLQARIVAVAGADIGAPGGPALALDSRLRLHRCPTAAQITAATGAQISAASGALRISCPALGWRLHVPLVGSASDDAAAVPAIRRGDMVALRIRGGGFAVVMRAIALEDGAVGARIRLRRASGSSAPIHAVVTAPGEVAPVG